MHSTCAVDITMSTVGSTPSITIDPLEPVLSTMASNKILQVIGDRNALAVDGLQEVLLDGIGVVAKGNLNGALEAVDVTVVAGTLEDILEPDLVTW